MKRKVRWDAGLQRVPLEESFAKMIQKTEVGCWLWQGSTKAVKKHSLGYGFLVRGEKELRAHRVSWQIHKGPIPAGMCVCHRCDVPTCVNPEHLFLGTVADNNRDRALKGRSSPLRGEATWCSKLTVQDVIEIRASNETQRRLAKRYGVYQSAISKVKTGLAWKHIPSSRRDS